MEKIIEIPEEVVNHLQRLSLETESRKDLIAFMLQSDMTTATEQFERYQKEYQDFYMLYQDAKTKFEKEYVRTAVDTPIKWNLDFTERQVTITY